MNMVEDENRKKFKGKKGNKRPFNNTNNGPNKKSASQGVVCWTCGKSGHYKRDCRTNKSKNGVAQNRQGQGSKDQGQSSQ